MDMSKKGRKVMRLADDDKLDEAVYLWFTQKRSQDMPVSGPVLWEKATFIEMIHMSGCFTCPAIAWSHWGRITEVLLYF